MIIDQSQARRVHVREERLAYLDRFLAKAAEDQINPSIVVCAARGNTEIFRGAYGVAAPGGPPLAEDMIADVASVTKTFVAAMIMILQEDGQLLLWDRLREYFPEFVGENKHEVTLFHLLTHSSGMDDDDTEKYVKNIMKRLLRLPMPADGAPEDQWNRVWNEAAARLGYDARQAPSGAQYGFFEAIGLGAPLKYRPGARFDYSNMGYRLLARIVEDVSGENLDDFARRRIFEPLGMKDSHFILPREKWSRVVKRAESCRGSNWYNSDENRAAFSGSSGLKTTAPDMLRFTRMILGLGTLDGARILSPASVRAMTADYNAALPREFWKGRWLGANWGFGWNIRADKLDDLGVLRSPRAVDHCGYGGARMLADPEYGLAAAFYLVDQLEDDYILHAKITNILYSALD
ncbi:MAG: beta-lactamase family protein [Peptococcaceae bacterium]|jgi:CubicO group peptidase (beta-lactamase class C family)|nr:beta-lactamase family protein [Peptococcaceae bacterium]